MPPAVRRVRRIVRKIDPWTVLKVSFVLYFMMSLAFVLGIVILWSVARNVGIPQGIDEIALKLTLLDEGGSIFADTERWFLIVIFLGVVWTVLMTGLTTLVAVMYNLVSDVVGGVEVVVLEETYNVPPPGPVRQAHEWTAAAMQLPLEEGAQEDTEGTDELADLPTQETAPVPSPAEHG